MSLAALLVDHPLPAGAELLATATRRMTHAEAVVGSHAAAARLEEAGLTPGGAVAARLTDSIDAVMTMVGTWLAGAVYVPVNPRGPAGDLTRVDAELGPEVVVDDDGARRGSGHGGRHDPDTAFVTWTSGTTGAPRPILHTHSGYLELLDRVLGQLRRGTTGRTGPPSPNLIPVSLALNAGLYNLLFGLRAGAPVVIMERFETAAFAQLIRSYAIRSTVLPPAAIAALNADPAVTDLAPLRYVRSITAPLSPAQATRFRERFGVFVLNGYGQAELGEVIGWTAADAKHHPGKLGAVGRPHPGVDVRIADDTGAEVVPGHRGRLLVRPPRTALDRPGFEELAGRTDALGYVDTGDLASIDADGFVWLEGRASDMINRGGNKVHPDEVEEVVRGVAGVLDAAVVAGPDERLGEVPVAFVVTAGDTDVSDADLEAACRAHLVAYKVPVAWHRVTELPRSEVGKLLRRQLSAQLTG